MKKILLKIVQIIAVCTFILCLVYLAWDCLILPQMADKSQQEIQSVYYTQQDTKVDKTERDAQVTDINKLKKINTSIAGWIRIPNTNIDYPVLQADAGSPEYYLNHDYKDNNSKYGSIFSDYRSNIENDNPKSVIIYGHSLRSGKMFSELNKYKSIEFYKTSPVIFFDTVNSKSQWKIFSVFLTNTLPEQGEVFNYIQTDFENESEFTNFIHQLRIRSLYNTGVDCNKDDKIILLSTCSNEFTNFREVIAARKERSGETNIVDISKVKQNNKVLYPDCWYKKYGGEKPIYPDIFK